MRVNLPGLVLGAAALLGVAAVQAPAPLPVTPGARVAPRSPAPQSDPRFGIHPNPLAPDSPPRAVFGVERLWDTGAIWCRMNPQPGVWDFSPMLTQLDEAAGRRAKSAIVVLGFPPPHAVPDPVTNPGEAPWLCPQPGYATTLPTDEVWDDYVLRTVYQVAAWGTRHPDVTVHFQVWNEPANRWFLAPGQQPRRMVELAARARQIVAANLPASWVVSPGIVPNSSERRTTWQQQFVAAATTWAQGAGQRLFDVWSVQVYPSGATFDEVWAGPTGYVAKMDDVLATIAPGRLPDDQVWVTEINANIAFTSAPSEVLSQADQDRFVQAVAADTAARGIPLVVWYRWHYDPWQVGSGQIVFGGSSSAMSMWPRG